MKLVVVTISNRNPDPEATESIARLRAPVLPLRGCSDLVLARNAVLTRLCLLQAVTKWDCAILVDDDMVFTPEDVQRLAEHAMQRCHPVSACYVLADGALAAAPYQGRWVTGLGLMAVPMSRLMEIYEQSPRFHAGRTGADLALFTQAGVIDGQWRPEDYQFCMRFGGVDLLPVRAGHVKIKTLYPSVDGLEEFLASVQAQDKSPVTAAETPPG